MIVNDVMSGKAKKLDYVIPSAMPGHITDTTGAYTEDLDKAKALLAEAGYADGFDMKLVISTGNQDYEDTAILVQAEPGEDRRELKHREDGAGPVSGSYQKPQL